jgi:hypothetical protein
LSHYARLCRNEPLVVTVNGVPAFELVPLGEDDDLIDQLIETAPAFSHAASRTSLGQIHISHGVEANLG